MTPQHITQATEPDLRFERTMFRLHRFLDVAAGEGYEFDGVDAADLFCEIFEDGALSGGAKPTGTAP